MLEEYRFAIFNGSCQFGTMMSFFLLRFYKFMKNPIKHELEENHFFPMVKETPS